MKERAIRVLIVDDNTDAATSLSLLLRLSGYETSTALTGASGIALAESFKPDVMLLDIGLPDMVGYEVCRTVRASSWGKDISIIAITGWGVDNCFSSSLQAGFDHHLVKPIEFADLCKYLSEWQTKRSTKLGTIPNDQ
ncbi:MAG: sensor hybrid histidine kinase [Planctomycetaceae bacterium]|nr:sensor hybrid histidine kinase [Planctomycetaceae bacterium]